MIESDYQISTSFRGYYKLVLDDAWFGLASEQDGGVLKALDAKGRIMVPNKITKASKKTGTAQGEGKTERSRRQNFFKRFRWNGVFIMSVSHVKRHTLIPARNVAK
jgi:hypothetical protein